MSVEIVLVPGMFSVGDVVYKELVEQLRTTLPEATSHVINLPSVDGIATNSNLEPNGLFADIDAIRATVKPLVDQGKTVILIGHSYGGTPALYAADGLWAKQTSGQGGVRKVGLISSSLTLPGGAVGGDREEWKAKNNQEAEPMPEIVPHGKEMFLIPKGFEEVWMNDLPDHKELRSSLRPSPLSTVFSPAPETDVKQWDIAFLATTEIDNAMPEAFQKHLADRAKEHGANVSWDTIASGHFVQVSHKEEVAKWISGFV